MYELMTGYGTRGVRYENGTRVITGKILWNGHEFASVRGVVEGYSYDSRGYRIREDTGNVHFVSEVLVSREIVFHPETQDTD